MKKDIIEILCGAGEVEGKVICGLVKEKVNDNFLETPCGIIYQNSSKVYCPTKLYNGCRFKNELEQDGL